MAFCTSASDGTASIFCWPLRNSAALTWLSASLPTLPSLPRQSPTYVVSEPRQGRSGTSLLQNVLDPARMVALDARQCGKMVEHAALPGELGV